MGLDGKTEAMPLVSEKETTTLEQWVGGKALPYVSRETVLVIPDQGGSSKPWGRYADALSDLYDVDDIDDKLTRGWWIRNMGLQPLVAAYAVAKNKR